MWILFKGDLTGCAAFQIDNPQIAMTTAIAKINQFEIVGACRRSLYGSSLMRDLDSSQGIVLRFAIDRIFPDIELSSRPAGDQVSVAIQIGRNIGSFPKSELPQILTCDTDRPKIHGGRVEHSLAARGGVHHARAIGKPREPTQSIGL